MNKLILLVNLLSLWIDLTQAVPKINANQTYIKNSMRLPTFLSNKKLTPELEAFMKGIADSHKHDMPSYTENVDLNCGPVKSKYSVPINWSNVMSFPQTSGTSGTNEIRGGDEERIRSIVSDNIGFDNDGQREELEANLKYFS